MEEDNMIKDVVQIAATVLAIFVGFQIGRKLAKKQV
jgi:hypothetical protein